MVTQVQQAKQEISTKISQLNKQLTELESARQVNISQPGLDSNQKFEINRQAQLKREVLRAKVTALSNIDPATQFDIKGTIKQAVKTQETEARRSAQLTTKIQTERQVSKELGRDISQTGLTIQEARGLTDKQQRLLLDPKTLKEVRGGDVTKRRVAPTEVGGFTKIATLKYEQRLTPFTPVSPEVAEKRRETRDNLTKGLQFEAARYNTELTESEARKAADKIILGASSVTIGRRKSGAYMVVNYDRNTNQLEVQLLSVDPRITGAGSGFEPLPQFKTGREFSVRYAHMWLGRKVSDMFGGTARGEEAIRDVREKYYPDSQKITNQLSKEFQEKVNKGIYQVDDQGNLIGKGAEDWNKKFTETWDKQLKTYESEYKKSQKDLPIGQRVAPAWLVGTVAELPTWEFFSPFLVTGAVKKGVKVKTKTKLVKKVLKKKKLAREDAARIFKQKSRSEQLQIIQQSFKDKVYLDKASLQKDILKAEQFLKEAGLSKAQINDRLLATKLRLQLKQLFDAFQRGDIDDEALKKGTEILKKAEQKLRVQTQQELIMEGSTQAKDLISQQSTQQLFQEAVMEQATHPLFVPGEEGMVVNLIGLPTMERAGTIGAMLSGIGLKEKEAVKIAETQFTLAPTMTGLKEKLDQPQLSMMGFDQPLISKVITKQIPKEKLDQPQLSMMGFDQPLDTKTDQPTFKTPGFDFPGEAPPRRPTTPGIPTFGFVPFPSRRQQKMREQPHDAYVYVDATKGIKAGYKKLNIKPLTWGSAMSAMARAVDQTISARGKVVPSKEIIQKGKKIKPKAIDTGDNYFEMVNHKFRQHKGSKKVKGALPTGTFIERQQFRLDSPGEVKKIHKAKRRASRIRDLFGI